MTTLNLNPHAGKQKDNARARDKRLDYELAKQTSGLKDRYE
jgi:hypothetical protein